MLIPKEKNEWCDCLYIFFRFSCYHRSINFEDFIMKPLLISFWLQTNTENKCPEVKRQHDKLNNEGNIAFKLSNSQL